MTNGGPLVKATGRPVRSQLVKVAGRSVRSQLVKWQGGQ